MLGALEKPCEACDGSGRRETPRWQQWNAELERLVKVAQQARQAAGLPIDMWVTGLDNVVGIHGGSAREVIEPAADVVAAEHAIAEHEENKPRYDERGVVCEECAGRRLVPSELGEQLLVLLERHGFLRAGRRPLPPPDPPRRPANAAYGQQDGRTGTTG